jgi:hypothetical protein
VIVRGLRIHDLVRVILHGTRDPLDSVKLFGAGGSAFGIVLLVTILVFYLRLVSQYQDLRGPTLMSLVLLASDKRQSLLHRRRSRFPRVSRDVRHVYLGPRRKSAGEGCKWELHSEPFVELRSEPFVRRSK